MTDNAIKRISHMEECFDLLQKNASDNPDALRDDAALAEMLISLTQYYESEQWLHDYELDEKGLLPPSLKRGVLSQDAVFDFLEQLK